MSSKAGNYFGPLCWAQTTWKPGKSRVAIFGSGLLHILFSVRMDPGGISGQTPLSLFPRLCFIPESNLKAREINTETSPPVRPNISYSGRRHKMAPTPSGDPSLTKRAKVREANFHRILTAFKQHELNQTAAARLLFGWEASYLQHLDRS